MTSNSDKVRAKIAALVAKTTANGASEAEAVNAMAIAEKLMREHGVTLEDIKNDTEAAHDFIKRKFNSGVKLTIMDKFVASAIGRYTDCKVWNGVQYGGSVRTPRSKTGYKAKYMANVMFFGYTVDVELAEYIYKTCESAMETEWKRFSALLCVGSRKEERKNFMLGMALRLKDRLDYMKVQNIENSGSTGTELMVLKSQLVAAAAKKEHGKLNNRKPVTTYRDNDAFGAGQAAADNVRFNREVQDGPQGGVKLIK